jgi:hypothetical protein
MQKEETMSDPRLVLIVDDDPDLVEAVAMKVESQNYRTAKAYDGVEAWERIRVEKPDLVILDVMMPRKNGYELCDELKKNPQYQDIVVLLKSDPHVAGIGVHPEPVGLVSLFPRRRDRQNLPRLFLQFGQTLSHRHLPPARCAV